MIEITYNLNDYELCMKGHAMSGRKGEDLICCAASVLANTLLQCLQANEYPFDAVTDEEAGYLNISVNVERDSAWELHIMFMTVLTGLHSLHEQYPEYVSFKGVNT